MFPEFHADKPLDKLIRTGIEPEHINESVLGRALDQLYELGVSEVYLSLAVKAINVLKLPCKALKLDSTSFHVDGRYNSESEVDEDDMSCIKLCRGYSRDHRPELNQAILLMMTENQAGIPVFMAASSGNVNDNKNFKKVINTHLKCYKEALNNTYCQAEPVITEKPCYTKTGRPEKGSQPDSTEFYVSGNPWLAVDCRKLAETTLGCFVLSTNDLDKNALSSADVLSTYKSQQSVERGFRFLKSPEFMVSALFLKKPERIEALLMVMTLCLLVYAAIQHRIRLELKKQSRFFPDMKRKPCQTPTARWVFFCFPGINVLLVDGHEKHVVSLQERQLTISSILGRSYQELYS